MNILVTGCKGQLGSEIKKIASTDLLHQWYFTDIDTLDICNETQVNHLMGSENIEVCINCAAYTAVDKAEEEPEKAYKINALAPKILADACKKENALLIQVSTDYVFKGDGTSPYLETDVPNPISVYGKTKYEGEKFIQNSGCNYFIIRTAWLYSATGNNFVKTMIRLAEQRDEIKVVCDQKGSPTWAFDLAAAIVYLVDYNGKKKVKEIFHYTNEGIISWYDFAVAIMEIAGKNCSVHPVSTAEYGSKTARPAYSVLDKDKFKAYTHIRIPYWRDSLIKCIEEIKKNQ